MMAFGENFFGVFSANNTPDPANFPQGVTYHRNHDFATKKLFAVNGTTEVAPSIDPFFFMFSPLHLTHPDQADALHEVHAAHAPDVADQVHQADVADPADDLHEVHVADAVHEVHAADDFTKFTPFTPFTPARRRDGACRRCSRSSGSATPCSRRRSSISIASRRSRASSRELQAAGITRLHQLAVSDPYTLSRPARVVARGRGAADRRRSAAAALARAVSESRPMASRAGSASSSRRSTRAACWR